MTTTTPAAAGSGADTVVTSMCRLCLAYCGIRVTLRDGRAVAVAGDPEHPLSRGYTCEKGRALPDQLGSPHRLLHTCARGPDGRHHRVAVADATDDIARRIGALLDRHGPRSVAIYYGTGSAAYPATMEVSRAFVRAIGSPMAFAPASIDQPGKQIATSLHGRWGGHTYTFATADVWMFVGTNPVVSMWGGMTVTDPLRVLRRAVRDGLRIVTVDPRRTELAALSEVHLRPHPGEDATLLAGMVRTLLDGGHHDHAFCADHVQGVEALAAAVAPFTPDVVERRTGVAEAEVRAAVDVLRSSPRGAVTAGTGANMTPHGTLTESLVLGLHTLCGFWRRAGEVVTNPGVLIEPHEFRAQPEPAPPPFGDVEMRARPLRLTSAGMPTAALADEILHDGPERVRALLCLGGNPVAAWPDQGRTIDAMRALDLLVCFDIRMSATARYADYVVGTKFMLEVPQVTSTERGLRAYGATSSLFPVPFAMYTPAIAAPPPGSELVEEWEVVLGVAHRLGLTLEVYGERLAPGDRPTTDELYDIIFRGTRVPLDTVRGYEHGHVFADAPPVRVLPADPDVALRLEVAHPITLDQLARLADRPDPVPTPDLPYRLIVRRMREAKNSSGIDIDALKRRHRTNPAFMHPAELGRLGLADGDAVEIRSTRASVHAVVATDAGVPEGAVSMAHAWGDGPERDAEFREIGACTGRLVDNHTEVDEITGMPWMTAIPVAVTPLAR